MSPPVAIARLLSAVAATVLIGSCFYAPSLEERQFTCRDGACPPGFECSGAPAFQCVTDLVNVRFDGGGDGPPPDTDAIGPDLPPDGPDGPVTECAGDKLEPNNDQVNASAIGPGTNLPAGIPAEVASLCPGDQDWYRVALDTQGLLVRLEARSVAGLVLELRNVGGKVLARGTSEGNRALVISNRALNPGTYFARVSGVTDAQGALYGLAIGSPPHDRCEGATPLSQGGAPITDDFSRGEHDYDPGAGSTCTGESETGRDLTYQMRLNAPRRVVIETDGHGDRAIDPSPGRTPSDLSLFLIQGDAPEACGDSDTTCLLGSTTAASSPVAVGRGDDPFIDATMSAGRYYLVVSNRATAQKPHVRISYDLDVECLARMDCTTGVPAFCSREHRCLELDAAFTEIGEEEAAGAPLPLPVPDADDAGTPGVATYDLMVDQFPASARVTELQVGLDIRHTWRGDLRVVVMAPPDPDNAGARQIIELFDRGGDADDSANHVIELVGSRGPLAQAVGVPASGLWTIEVSDLASDEVGEVRDVRLFIRTQ